MKTPTPTLTDTILTADRFRLLGGDPRRLARFHTWRRRSASRIVSKVNRSGLEVGK